MVKTVACKCEVSFHHVISIWDDADLPSCFVSVVSVHLSAVQASTVQTVQVKIPDHINFITYSYWSSTPCPWHLNTMPRMDESKNCRGSPPNFQTYHPFVYGFSFNFKQFQLKNNDMSSSRDYSMLGNGITIEKNIAKLFPLKFSAESTIGIIVTLLRTAVDSYKDLNNIACEIEA